MKIKTSEDFGTWVRGMRRAQGLTQHDLAGLAGVGPRFIVELEAGKPTIELNRALRIAVILGGTIDVSGPRQ